MDCRSSGGVGWRSVTADGFEDFVVRFEPKLHAAFIARYGHDSGREATAVALAYAWEHWDRVHSMENPVGYLFRVGQTSLRQTRVPVTYLPPSEDFALTEPKLLPALARLPKQQRISLILTQVEGWKLREVAELLKVSVPTVQKHVERGLASLRRSLGVEISKEPFNEH